MSFINYSICFSIAAIFIANIALILVILIYRKLNSITDLKSRIKKADSLIEKISKFNKNNNIITSRADVFQKQLSE